MFPVEAEGIGYCMKSFTIGAYIRALKNKRIYTHVVAY